MAKAVRDLLRYDIGSITAGYGTTHFELDPRRRIARMWAPEAFAWIVDWIEVTLLATGKVVLFHRTNDESCRQYVVNLDEATFAELQSVLEKPRQEPPVPRLQYDFLHHDQSRCGDIYSDWGAGPELWGSTLEVFRGTRLARVYATTITPHEGVRLVLEMYKVGDGKRDRFECVETAKDSRIYDFTLDSEAFDRLSRILSNKADELFEFVWTRG